MGKTNELLEVTKADGKVYLRITFDMLKKQYRFSRSKDNKKFTAVGEPFFVDFGHWKGVRFGIYHYNRSGNGGYITVDNVKYDVLR